MSDLTTLDSDILDTIHCLIERANAAEERRVDRPASATTRTAYALVSYFDGRDFGPASVSEFGYGDKALDEALEVATRQAERFPAYIYMLVTRTETLMCSQWEAIDHV